MRRFSVLLPALLAILVGASPALAWTWPVDGPVLQPFSLGDDPYAAGHHRGIDIAAPFGTPVAAPASGLITFAGTVPGGGKTVTIKTGDGYAVTLVHLGSMGTQRGLSVAEGDVVGTIGPSGEAEHAEPYVHLGIRVASEPEGYVDPLTLLPARKAVAPPEAPADEPAPPEPSVEEPAPPEPSVQEPAPPESSVQEPARPESAAEEPPPTTSDGGDSAEEAPSAQPAGDPVTMDASALGQMKPVAWARPPVMTVPSRPLVGSSRPPERSTADAARRGHATSRRALGAARPVGPVAGHPHVRIDPAAVPEVAVLPRHRANPGEIGRDLSGMLLAAGILATLVGVGGTLAIRRRSRPARAPGAESRSSATSPTAEVAATASCETLNRVQQRRRRVQHVRGRASAARSARTLAAGGRR